ncbi:polysaccharide deacetylase family protein [Sediminibacterium soli]|uniref:polysaccharide deacetylase family protein n=1 Tax=Sediminibacterium soli TaxID=2698829 RepID=UPI00137AF038|nr:polysaccharide deacetylase family protein [Sediminibacterium soli]NCI45243.1 polysaccharide deacetylase family protein [Sediminibacterium soli]
MKHIRWYRWVLIGMLSMAAGPAFPQAIQPLRYIYLSFDDGPLEGSENIDSVVLAEKLNISVFLVGEHAVRSRQLGLYYKMYEQNPFVESYNHSFTHAHDRYRAFYSNPRQVVADIEMNEQVLKLRYRIVRLPGRNMWRVGNRKRDDLASGSVAADMLAQKGFRLYGWDIEWAHHPKDGSPVQSADEMAREIETRLEQGKTFTRDHIVVLIHDEMFRKKWEQSALKQLIDKLRSKPNYRFAHIRNYP